MAQERPFLEKPPAKNMDDYLDKGADMSKKAVNKTGVVIKSIGSNVGDKFNKWFK
jgi:hypothetical protein